ncbi:AraC-like DNA-binding protein [Paenibacillus phyllosphaerae]|uniref:AraC-like DNA-binding protein n=1 Tax=Paenibacillus phyllosphaerae TaxID=274593 RepID=A0A7W5AWT8_9BACL|nr:helix-turn-helix domain-containing protein [Paenibacillus phyllosphaerae]MBB3110198.1 AraC-like DNA-binding protein [Paenibacillus phyllosphaerae]
MLTPLLNRSVPSKAETGAKPYGFRYKLMLILLVACLPGLAIGFGIYGTVTGKMERELQSVHQNQMEQRVHNIDEELSDLELSFAHWAFDPAFDKQLKTLDFVHGYEQVQELYRKLIVADSFHKLIGHVELYLKSPRPLLMNADRYTFLTDADSARAYESWIDGHPSMFWTSRTPDGTGVQGTLVLINRLPALSSNPAGYMMVTLDKGKLLGLLRTLSPYDSGAALLLAEDGSRVLPGGTNDLEDALYSEVASREGEKAAFVFEQQGVTYSVNKGEITRLGSTWTFVSAVPLSAITAPVITLSQWIVGISAVGLALALVLAMFASWRLYVPWRQLAQESGTLRERLDRQLPMIRESFLLQFAQGRLLHWTNEQIRARFEQLGWPFIGERCAVIVLHLGQPGGLTGGEEQQREAGLLTDAALDLAKELAAGWQLIRAEAFHDQERSIGLLIHLPDSLSAEESREQLLRLAEQLAAWLDEAMPADMPFTLAISRNAATLDQVPLRFEEARQAHRTRRPREERRCQLIDLHAPQPAAGTLELQYPFALEKEVIYAIRGGLQEEAASAVRKFVQELSGSAATEHMVQQGMLQLLGGIQHAMLQLGLNPVRLFEGANLFEGLSKLRHAGEMADWFEEHVIAAFIDAMGVKQQSQQKETIEKLALHIRQHYNTNLSLDELAEKAGMNTYALSRAFKDVLGVNYIDYLTGLRMERAKELLAGSDMKMNAIAEHIGYQPSYFNRLFKKSEGITPRQYRELRQQPEGHLPAASRE